MELPAISFSVGTRLRWAVTTTESRAATASGTPAAVSATAEVTPAARTGAAAPSCAKAPEANAVAASRARTPAPAGFAGRDFSTNKFILVDA